MNLKHIFLVGCLLYSFYSIGNVKTSLHLSGKKVDDTLPNILSIPEKLKLVFKVAGVPYDSKFEALPQTDLLFRLRTPPFNEYLPTEFLDSLEMSIKDFVYYENTFGTAGLKVGEKNEILSIDQKANLVRALIGWPGWVHVDHSQRWISFDFVVPQKEYGKRKMKKLSNYYAGITNEWILRSEQKKGWLISVHFERIDFLSHRLYTYCGDNNYDMYNARPTTFRTFKLKE